jgi:catechol 2,3-dioxygenase-like lactoylglutathione lyase family enzyme
MSTFSVTGFHHTALRVVDFDACLAFYHGLGLTTARSWGESPRRGAMLDAGDQRYVEVFEGGDPDAPAEARMAHIALRTADCDATHAKALELGATERLAPVSKHIPSIEGDFPVRLSFVFSPTGEIIEFFQNDVT